MNRNIFAIVIVIALGAALYVASSLPVSAAWMTSNWWLVGPVLLVMTNYVVKLTTWKGDDALWAIARRAIEKKLKP